MRITRALDEVVDRHLTANAVGLSDLRRKGSASGGVGGLDHIVGGHVD